MLPILFFSYSHADETLRNQLEVHLSGLKRQGLIGTWHDRRITVGSHVGNSIDANLEAASLVLLLVSPDFIASDYCYEREMTCAMERHRAGDARVIPVILRPCDWHDLPFGELMATPRDGKAITTWPNIDEAFLDVVREIKRALKELGPKAESALPKVPAAAPFQVREERQAQAGDADIFPFAPRSSNLRLKREFTELDRDLFRQEGFEFICRFFENSLKELVERNPALNLAHRFQRVDAHHFTAAIYRDGEKVCKGSASIGSGIFGGSGIEYSMDDSPRHGGMNEAVTVNSDDQMLYFTALGMQSFGSYDKDKLTAQGAAELFWGLFIRPLQ